MTSPSPESLSLFHHSVPDATAAFLDAVTEHDLEHELIEHPLAGPDGEALFTVVARWGGNDAHTVLLCISGTHGLEGYAGSALQIGGLRTGILEPPEGIAVVIVHLINPWGTAWSARENEDNVELLRHHYYQHHHKAPNEDFVRFYEQLRLGEPGSLGDFFERLSGFGKLLAEIPPDRLMASLVSGQNTHPDSITYVGTEPTWSKRVLDRVIVEHCSSCERVVVLDLHTGTGPPGETIAMHMTRTDQRPEEQEMVRGWFGELWDSGEDVPLWSWVEQLLPKGPQVVGVVFENGTEELGAEDQYIFPLDVWMRFHGDPDDPAYAEHRARYRRFYYPENDQWCESAWATGAERLRQLMRGIAEWGIDR